MISTEMAMTPGVELPQEPAVENEHLPAENLPPPEIKEIKGPDVEKLTNISDGLWCSYITPILQKVTCHPKNINIPRCNIPH